jgi:hypothetical protein
MTLVAWVPAPGWRQRNSEMDVDADSDETNTFDTTHDLAPLSAPTSVDPASAARSVEVEAIVTRP